MIRSILPAANALEGFDPAVAGRVLILRRLAAL